MSQNNRGNFLDPQGEFLAPLNLDVKDVSLGRYIEINLDTDSRQTKAEEFAEFGRFDTLTVLNPGDIKSEEIWIYLNKLMPLNRMPLNRIAQLETVADKFYLQHAPIAGKTLRLVIGGDLRAFGIQTVAQGEVSISDSVSINNFPAIYTASVNNFPVGFNVNNFPVGFDVTNLPATYPIVRPDVIGTHANLWDNQLLGINEFSTPFDMQNYPHLSLFGHMDPPCDLVFEVSANNVNWYKCLAISEVLPGNQSTENTFHWWGSIGARYVRLGNIQESTITATAQAKY